MTTASYYADTSEFQVPYTSAYPYSVAMFRFHSGYFVDPVAATNWAYHKTAINQGRTRLLYAYAVFVPGQLSTVLSGLKQVFGPSCPTNRLVIVIDMESGSDFAGPGNHSAEANIWVGGFQAWGAQVDPYANVPDYAECWPQLAPSLTRRHISKYSATAPAGAYSWQYYGATSDPSPAGAPRSCPPFGTEVDMNVIYRSIDQIEADYGISNPPVPPSPIQEDDEVPAANVYKVNDGPSQGQYWCLYGDGRYVALQEAGDDAALVHGGAIDCTGFPISAGLHAELIAASPNKGTGNANAPTPAALSDSARAN